MFGSFCLGEIAYAELPPGVDFSTESEFRLLLQNPYAEFTYLVVLEPYDATAPSELASHPPFGSAAFGEPSYDYTGGIRNYYLSDKGYKTKPTDPILPNVNFLGRVDNPYTLDLSLFSGTDQTGFAQASAPFFGSITIINADGALDDLANMSWRGRKVKIYTGRNDFDFNDFELIFDGVSAGIEVDDERIIVNLSDQSYLLDRFIEVNQYLGTGGLEGFSDLKGIPKPMAFGKLVNIEPVLIDAAKLIYQVHDGAILAIDAVRDRGVALTFDSDTISIETTTPSAGKYVTDLSRGLLRLGSTPAGQITIDCRGENVPSYVDEVGSILLRILRTRMGVNAIETNLIDLPAFGALSQECGVYLTEPTVIAELMDLLITPYAAYWTFTRKGLLTTGIVEVPTVEEYTITDQMIDYDGIELVGVFPAVWKQQVAYAPIGLVQGTDDLASGATTGIRELVQEKYRYLVAEDRGVRSADINAVERVDYINAVSEADAQAVLDRLVALYGKERRLYRVSVRGMIFRVYLGKFIKLIYPRFGLQNGKLFVVIGLAEDAESDTTILELWG